MEKLQLVKAIIELTYAYKLKQISYEEKEDSIFVYSTSEHFATFNNPEIIPLFDLRGVSAYLDFDYKKNKVYLKIY
jgi:hypothetical protein